MPRWLVALAIGVAVVFIAAIGFTVVEPIQVLPRRDLAPGYALVDANGDPYTSESGRGAVTLYSFASPDCGEQCQPMWDVLGSIAASGPELFEGSGAEFRVVTVALATDASPGGTASGFGDTEASGAVPASGAVAASGADGTVWRWVGGPIDKVALLSEGLGVPVTGGPTATPIYVIVDGNGIVRGEYRYRTVADDTDKLLRHLDILAGEIRNADGVASVAYSAAHLFLCYP